MTDITPGRRGEWIHVYAKAAGQAGFRVGTFDLTPEPGIYEVKGAELTSGQVIYADAVRFMRSRPGLTGIVNYTNPLTHARINVAQLGTGTRFKYTPLASDAGRILTFTATIYVPASGHLVRPITASISFKVAT